MKGCLCKIQNKIQNFGLISILAILLAIVVQIGSSIYSFSSLETKVSYIHDELITMKKNDERFDRRLYAAEQEIALLKYIIDHNKEKK